MALIVKNTTKIGLLDMLCPHHCRGCGRLGAVFCERCKNYIVGADFEAKSICFNNSPFEFGVAVERGEGPVFELLKEYKYGSVRALADVLAEFLARILPEEGVVVPLPTIGRHVRERGFDHMAVLARKAVRMSGLECRPMLARAKNTVQVGADAETRLKQAEGAYRAQLRAEAETLYILIDDVLTTGASIEAAAKAMRLAGARRIGVATLVAHS